MALAGQRLPTKREQVFVPLRAEMTESEQALAEEIATHGRGWRTERRREAEEDRRLQEERAAFWRAHRPAPRPILDRGEWRLVRDRRTGETSRRVVARRGLPVGTQVRVRARLPLTASETEIAAATVRVGIIERDRIPGSPHRAEYRLAAPPETNE